MLDKLLGIAISLSTFSRTHPEPSVQLLLSLCLPLESFVLHCVQRDAHKGMVPPAPTAVLRETRGFGVQREAHKGTVPPAPTAVLRETRGFGVQREAHKGTVPPAPTQAFR